MGLFIFPLICHCNVFPWRRYDKVLLLRYRIISPFSGHSLPCVVVNAGSCVVLLPLYGELLPLSASCDPSCAGHMVHLLVTSLPFHTRVEMVSLPWSHVLLYDTPLM